MDSPAQPRAIRQQRHDTAAPHPAKPSLPERRRYSRAREAATAAAAKTPPASRAVVESTPDPPVNKMRRRIVWATVAGFLTTCFLMFVRFFLPRSILEPSSTFRIGSPSDYALGVDTKWQQQYRIWVTRLPIGCL